MQELTDALATRVAGTARLGAGVESIGRAADGGYVLRCGDCPPIVAEAVLLAVPAADAARLIAPIAPRVAGDLARLRTVGAGSVALAYREDEVRRPLAGYGLVVPRRERRPINAITVASRKFDDRAPAGWHLLRVFFGGARSPTSLLLDDDCLIQVVRDQLRDLLGIEAPPAFHRVYRWSAASPQYDVGHLERIAEIEQTLPSHVFVTGSAYHGVGLPDLVRSATAATDQIIAASCHKQGSPTHD
jgi:oxygen-dependent protoporphyrinogen oxidase